MSDVLIVGGGVIGMLTARELCLAGAEVTLIERGDLARESSWAGGGILSPLYPWRYPGSVTALATDSQSVYPQLCETLHEDTGIDPQYRQTGLIIHAPDETSLALNWAAKHGHKLIVIDAREIAELEPARSQPPQQALWMPDIAQVRNPRLVKALADDLRQRGVKIHTHTAATGLMLDNGRVQGVQTKAGVFRASATVLAMGAWTGRFSQMLPKAADIRPVRGQMLLFRGKPGQIRHMMLEENRYVIPRKDGRMLFGSTLEETGFDQSTTPAARQELAQLARQRFPLLKDCPIEKHWAGLRPAAPAGVPYITGHPHIENLYINAGHYRNGVVLAPGSARLVTDLLLGRKTRIDPTPYALDAPRG